MIAIITALMAEARPLINHFKLGHLQEPSMVRLWGNESLLVVVTGTSKVKSAAVTSSICTCFNGRIDAVINLGLAGAAFEASLGQLFLTNKIIDHYSQTDYYPEMLLKTSLKESALRTFDHPVTIQHLQQQKIASTYKGLIDMEAAGFFEASLMFLPATRISCLKIVSDFLEGSKFSRKKASQLIEKNIPDIEEYIGKIEQLIIDNNHNTLTPKIEKMMDQISGNLNLTVTQQRQLKKQVIYRTLTHEDAKDALTLYLNFNSNNKQERNSIFKELLSRLSSQ